MWAALTPLVLNYLLSETANAYAQALTDTHSASSGTYTWGGVSPLQSPLHFTVAGGTVTHDGGAWTPLVYVLLLAGTVACGRLWRLLPSTAQRRQS